MSNQLLVPLQEYETRAGRTQALLEEQGLDGIVVFSSVSAQGGHVTYLTNYRGMLPAVPSQASQDLAAFVLPARGAGILIAPTDCEDGTVVNVESVCTGGDLVSDTVKAVEGYCGGSARWGLTGLDVFPAAHYLRLADGLTGMAWEPADVILAEQRQIKSAAEIVALARAADVATAGLEAGLAAAVPAASRYQVELAVRRGCLEAGAELVHGVRVAAGASLQQQAPPIDSLSLLKEGDFVYLQVWGWVQGYAFNASRVQVIGSPSDQQQEYLQHLVEAAEWMVSSIKPDRRFTFYYAESRGREIYPRAHGIGLELAEAPWIRIQQSFVARQGMVFCVAPIVACRTFGRMSVSRTIVIEKNGPKTL